MIKRSVGGHQRTFVRGSCVARVCLFLGYVSVRWINVRVVALLRVLLDAHCKDGIHVPDDTADRNGDT